jgi:hypothetical protein
MADFLDKVVKVEITRQTAVPSMASFSDLLIMDTRAQGVTQEKRVKKYGGLSELVDAGFAGTSFAYMAAQKQLSQSPHIGEFYVGLRSSDEEDWDTALQAVQDENNDWYAIIAGTRVMSEQQAVAEWIQAAEKLGGLATGDPALINTASGDLAAWAKTSNLDRVFVFFHPDIAGGTDPIPEAALFGKMLTKHPGSATWALKDLASVPTYNLTSGQFQKSQDKNAMVYVSMAGLPVTQDGKVASGEYIDVIHGCDWLAARIQNLVFMPMKQQDKISFTDVGQTILIDAVRAGLQEGAGNKIITADYEITSPMISDMAKESLATYKGTRTLPPIKFTAPLDGAIQHVSVEGTIVL